MDKFRSLFIDNFWWKLLSLALAILLWLIGMSINNPELRQNFSVPITFKNSEVIAENGLVLLNQDTLLNTNVTINVSATKQRLEALNSNRIKAEIDFAPVNITSKEYAGETKSVELIVTLPTGYEYTYISPRIVDLKYDLYTSKEFEINVIKIGTPAENYDALSNMTSTPNKVTLSGAQSDIDKVSSVTATIDVSGAVSSVTETVEIIVYDSEGTIITDLFDRDHLNAEVIVPIYMSADIPISPITWTGTPANGYEVSNVILEPTYVEVFGTQTDIDKLVSIDIEPANVNGAVSNVTMTYNINDLLVGSNLSKKNGTADELVITYIIKEMINKTITVPIENFTIKNLKDEVELPTSIDITVYGNTDLVSSLDPLNIDGIIDFDKFDKNVGNASIKILNLPDGISFNGPNKINVNVENTDQNIDETLIDDQELVPSVKEKDDSANEVDDSVEEKNNSVNEVDTSVEKTDDVGTAEELIE